MNRAKEFLAFVFLTPSLLAFVWVAAALPVQAQNLRAATASSYIERGNEWLAKGEYERALADYDLAIATDPSQVNAYCNRAITRCLLGKRLRRFARRARSSANTSSVEYETPVRLNSCHAASPRA